MDKNLSGRAKDLRRIEDPDFWSKVKIKLILCLVEGATVLDVGCGSGLLSKTLMDKGYRVVAVDNDCRAVETSKKKGVPASLSDIKSWKTEEKFDCVILADVLEHIEDDQSVMRKVHGMLKPAGCVVANVPSYHFLFGKHDEVLGHKRRYSDMELKAKLEASGFKIEFFSHWNLLVLPVTVLTKISGKDYPLKALNISGLSVSLEKLLLLELKVNKSFGLSILCKARK
jgi:SAM-dependent methyltransferase